MHPGSLKGKKGSSWASPMNGASPGAAPKPFALAGAGRPGTLIVLMATAFAVSMGYGVALPLLPAIIERFSDGSRGLPAAWYAGLLPGAYTAALFAFAPALGALSDRLGRRAMMLGGMAAYAPALALFAAAPTLAAAIAAQVLAGVAAAAVLPAALAATGESGERDQASLRLAWVSAASLLGFLAGPALGGWLGDRQESGIGLPFLVAAGITALAATGAAVLVPETARCRQPDPGKGLGQPRYTHIKLAMALAVTVLVTYGLGSFEVGFSLFGEARLGLDPSRLGHLFALCMAVMIPVQLAIFPRLLRTFRPTRVSTGALAALGIGLAMLPVGENVMLAAAAIVLIAAGAGVLLPALSYWVSLDAAHAPGAALGKQVAAFSLGQALGSVAAGVLFEVMPSAPFWVAAALALVGALAVASPGRRTALGLSKPPPLP